MAYVLVIDDSAGGREPLSSVLSAHGHEASFADGADAALQLMDEADPDALLVDVSVSGFDAVDFVVQALAKNARVPIVLMSSHGHDGTVIKALQKGASSYLPRDLLDQELRATLNDVLAYSREQECQMRMMARMTELNCHFELDSDRTLIAPLVSYLQGHIGRLGICDDSDLVRVGIALDEALVNALQHGNLELDSELRENGNAYHELAEKRMQQSPYSERKLHVSVRMSSELAEIVIRDEGPGFDVSLLPDPRDPANLEKVSGRGILLMRTFMDEVVFSDDGNTVTLRKVRS